MCLVISLAQNGNFRSSFPNIEIDGMDTSQVFYADRVGVTISHDLTWNEQVGNVISGKP